MADLSKVIAPDDNEYDLKDARIAYGTCATAAATAAKEVTLDNDPNFTLRTGSIIGVKFTYSNSANNVTLNVNNTGAKSVWYNNSAYTGKDSGVTGYANRTSYFMYDGTYWVLISNGVINGNTYDRTYLSNTGYKAGSAAIASANIIVAGSDGLYHHLKTGTAFDITMPILYASSACNANAANNGGYLIIPFTVTTTQSITLTEHKPVYIKGTLSGTTFTPISTTPLTQTVPTTDDGYEYMLLGKANTSTVMYLLPEHPIYAYRGGKFGRVSGDSDNAIVDITRSGTTFTATRSDGSTFTFTQQDNNTWTANSSSAAGYVASGSGQNDKMWATDTSGNPSWRNSALLHGSRTGSADDKHSRNTDERLFAFLATSGMTTGKPPHDAHILHFNWDNGTATTGTWDSQLAITNNTPRMYIRAQDNGTWSSWSEVFSAITMEPHVRAPLGYDNSQNQIYHLDTGVAAAPKGDTTNQTPGFGSTFKVLSGTVNATGHLTAFADHTVKIPNATASTSAAGLMSTTQVTTLNNVSTVTSGTLTWASGFTKRDYGSFIKRVGKIGMLHLNFTSDVAYTASTQFATLPSGFRPVADINQTFRANAGNEHPYITITTAGAVKLGSYTGSQSLGIRQIITFPLA